MALVDQFTLTGVGDQDITVPQVVNQMETDVTTLGFTTGVLDGPPDRLGRIGWWCVYEKFVSDPDGVPDGKHYGPLHWIEFAQQSDYRIALDTLTGIDGIHYNLGSGTTVVFTLKHN